MKKRHSPEQIISKLREADVALGKGLEVPEVCRQRYVSEQTYYRWRTLILHRRMIRSPTIRSPAARTTPRQEEDAGVGDPDIG